MVTRLPGFQPTRSGAVLHNGLVYTVAVAAEITASAYDQTRQALTAVDRSLAALGTDKDKILTAMVYLADILTKPEMNRAWDEWASLTHPPVRACVGAALEPGYLVEIVVTAATTVDPKMTL